MNNQPDETRQPPFIYPQNYQAPFYSPQQGQQPYPPAPYPPRSTQYGNPAYRNYTPPSQFQTQPPVPPLPPYRPPQNGGFPWKGTLIILCIALPIMFAIFFLIINHLGLTSTPSKIGDTITVNGVSCTVISTQGPTNLTAGFSMVDVKIVNNSNQEINYNATDFSVVTTNGNIIDASSSGSSLQMVSGSLAPGGSIEGNIGFALFDTQDITKMIWQPSGTTDLSYAWYIKF
jgi:Domain of unknown function (DUF4352)